MLFNSKYQKFFWLTKEGRLACASSTDGTKEGMIEGNSLEFPDMDVSDEFSADLREIAQILVNQIIMSQKNPWVSETATD